MAKFLSMVFDYCLRKAQRITSKSAFLFAVGLLSGSAAEAAVEMTKEEYQLLPPYCQSQGHVAGEYFKPDNKEKWRNRLGDLNYAHIHHYCWAQVLLTRAYKPGLTEAERKYLFRGVISDTKFSLARATPDFALLPEMYTKVGEAYLGMQDDKNAEIAFRKAWDANPAYWPPYVWWSQRLLKQGKVREALAVAEEGNKNAPGSKALEKLIEEIRGAGKASRK